MLRAKSALLTLGTISILALGACAPQGGSAEKKVSVSDIENSKKTAAEKAEALSELSARLVTPTSFMFAYEVSVRALAQDPSNQRAKFLKGILAPQMELKGIVKRLAPLAVDHPKLLGDFKHLVKSIQGVKDQNLKSFAMDGPADITTERQAQEVIAQYTVRLDDLRKTLGGMKDTEFSLRINTSAQKSGASGTDCHITMHDGSYDFSQCDESSVTERTVNQADIEIMKQYVAYAQVYLTVANSYDASGALDLSGHAKSKSEIYSEILRNASAGQLRKTNGLGVIPDMARDAVVGVRWAMEKQKEICATGVDSEANRPNNLFSNGACIAQSEKTESVLKTIELAMKGSQIQIPFAGQEITVVPLKLFESPVQDLRSEPLTFNSCGEVTSVGYGTLNGAFPKGDLNKVLKTSSNCQ